MALCQRRPVAPKIRKPNLASQNYLSKCDGPETLAAILAGIERYKASDEVARGIVTSLENFLADDMWLGTFCQAEDSDPMTAELRRKGII